MNDSKRTYLSFDEAMIYAQLGRMELRLLLVGYEIPVKHIALDCLDKLLEREAHKRSAPWLLRRSNLKGKP